jgi:hypothetical protein
MTTSEMLDNLRSRILAGYSLLFLRTWEEARWESELAELSLELERGLVTWSVTTGPQPPWGEGVDHSPEAFLDHLSTYPGDHVFFVKDFHPYLSDPAIVRRLRDQVQALAAERKTLLFIGPNPEVPLELRKDSVVLDLPLPGLGELSEEWSAVLAEREASGQPFEITPEGEERLLKGMLGLTAAEARRAMSRAIVGKDAVDDEVFASVVAEKRVMVQGSDLLEFYDFDAGVRDVGGLDNLKDWLLKRSDAFTERAREQGIPLPKGVLLLGVQGCGKSLTARATARLLNFPLVRLDVANLLASDLGASERNLRDVLRIMELVSPAVLWLDELEKGFAGSEGGSSQSVVMQRLIGSFLTWMESRKAPVFVVATANSIANLPPEMLRRGRFDEMFFIDLPNFHERNDIIEIHLSRRGWKPEKFDIATLAERTEGFSGAELEQIVAAAMIDAYGEGRLLTDDDLEKVRFNTVPLSITMEEKIFELREWASTRARRATSDSRVTKMIEDEQRQGTLHGWLDDDGPKIKEQWRNLAEMGQLNAALVEYVRTHDPASLADIESIIDPYLPARGDQGMALKSDLNCVVWSGVSKEFIDLLQSLIAARRLHLHACDVAMYKSSGKTLPLPVRKELPAEKLERPEWLPCTVRVVPSPGAQRLSRIGRVKLLLGSK